MMLKLNVDALKTRMEHCVDFRIAGKLVSAREILTARLNAALGELCEIPMADRVVKAEVIGVEHGVSQLMTFHHVHGLRPGLDVIAAGHPLRLPVGPELIGRTIDGEGRPFDGDAPLTTRRRRSFDAGVPHPMTRSRIRRPLVTGQRAIDGLLTIGQGQRVGIFAGSGVGKSTLLGEIARHAQADVNVIVLVGERGREVLPFLEDSLGEGGRRRSVVVVATSDETPLMKIQAVRTAMVIAEDFRSRGGNVLFFLDSLTRLAFALRELGLSRGETPGQRGYPPSVTTTLASFLERLGNDDRGSITGLITVLVDGDDLDEPIADAARSILDGHIVLSRKLAAKNHYPAIDVLHSLSRLFRDVAGPEQIADAAALRRSLATYEEVAEMIQIGLYKPGGSAEVDAAVARRPELQRFLCQEIGEKSPFEQTLRQLRQAAGSVL